MFEELEKLGLNFEEKSAVLENFMRLFLEYNQKLNLISRNDAAYLFEKHIYDSLAVNLFIQKYQLQGRLKLLDIGTGGGFPALPVSVFFDNFDITAVDSIGKKINFVKTAAETLGLKNIHPVCSRIEELKSGAEFDIALSRAAAELRIISEYALPYIKKGGYFAAYKASKAEEEIRAAKNALKILKAEVIDLIEYTLPLKETHKRLLVIIRKNAETPAGFPRRNGIAAKKPL